MPESWGTALFPLSPLHFQTSVCTHNSPPTMQQPCWKWFLNKLLPAVHSVWAEKNLWGPPVSSQTLLLLWREISHSHRHTLNHKRALVQGGEVTLLSRQVKSSARKTQAGNACERSYIISFFFIIPCLIPPSTLNPFCTSAHGAFTLPGHPLSAECRVNTSLASCDTSNLWAQI